jgi:hypothetical protein
MSAYKPLVVINGGVYSLDASDSLQIEGVDPTGDFTLNTTESNSLNFNTGDNTFGNSSDASVIVMGKDNTLNGVSCAVVGGQSNNIDNGVLESAIVGGNDLVCKDQKSFMGGGFNVDLDGYSAGTLAGRDNTISGSYAAGIGGKDNTLDSTRGVVIAGGLQTCNGYSSGIYNSFVATNEGDYASILGGRNVSISANTSNSAVVSGNGSSVNADNAVCVGGNSNTNNGDKAVTIGGNSNEISTGCYSAVCVGGEYNTVNSPKSAIVAGRYNQTNDFYSVILGGQYNTVHSKYGVAMGKYAVNDHWGAFVHTGGRLTNNGDCQSIHATLGTKLSGGQTGPLYLDALGGNEFLTVPQNSRWYIQGQIIASIENGDQGAAYRFEALAERGTGSASIEYSNLHIDHESNSGFNFGINIANSTDFNIYGTVASGYANVNWAAHVQITQVTGSAS